MKKEKAVAFNMPAVTEGMPVPDFTETSARASPLERWLARKTLPLLGDPPLQMVVWKGEEITTSSARPAARVALRRRSALYKLLSNPNLQFGDLYSVGSVEVEGDLVKFLEIAYGTSAAKFEFLRKFQSHVLNRPRANTLAGSSSNIHHHYDLSNDFYQLWLDREMQYTCAYFPSPSMTLEEAQIAKLDHVCRKLQLRPGDRVVEAGSGWGGLARHMARHYRP